ncbi:hypothetical protein HMPREF1633_04775 [Tissierellia bacterium S5-A11]|nr:hypothetical protein HMPREF1633_04775 [Tissierellia bacterium S5-A11]
MSRCDNPSWIQSYGGFSRGGVEKHSKYEYAVLVKDPVGNASESSMELGRFKPGERIEFSVPKLDSKKKLISLDPVSMHGKFESEDFVTVKVQDNKALIKTLDNAYSSHSSGGNDFYRYGKMGMTYEDPYKSPVEIKVKLTLDGNQQVSQLEITGSDIDGAYHPGAMSGQKKIYEKYLQEPKFLNMFKGRTYQEIADMDFRYRNSKDFLNTLPDKIGSINKKSLEKYYNLHLIAQATQKAILNALGQDQTLSKEGLKVFYSRSPYSVHSSDCYHHVYVLVNKDGRILSCWDNTREDLGPNDGGIKNAGNEKALKAYREGLGYDRFVGLHKDEVNKLDMSAGSPDSISGATETSRAVKDTVIKALEGVSFPDASQSKKYKPVEAPGVYEGTGRAYQKKAITPDNPVEYIVFEEKKKDHAATGLGNPNLVTVKTMTNEKENFCKFRSLPGKEVSISSPTYILNGISSTRQYFSHWEVKKGSVDLKDAKSRNTSFTMGDEEVQVEAVYVQGETAKFTRAEILDANPKQVALVMDKALYELEETAENAGDFQVKIGKGEYKPVKSYLVSGNTAFLNLEKEVSYGDQVSVKYDQAHSILKSAVGEEPCEAFEKEVDNKLSVKITPTGAVVENYNPRDLVVSFSQDLEDIDHTLDHLEDFTVNNKGQKVDLEAYYVKGKELTIQMTQKAQVGDQYTVSYNNQNGLLRGKDTGSVVDSFQDQAVRLGVQEKKLVTVVAGGKNIYQGSHKPGEEVSIEAPEKNSEGKKFKNWNVRVGEVRLKSPEECRTSFTMGSKAVYIEAQYHDQIDKSDLDASIEKAKAKLKDIQVSPDGKNVAKDKTWVTEEVKKALEEALEKAEKVQGDPTAKLDTIKEAIKNLDQATENFVGKPGLKGAGEPSVSDKDKLKDVIEKAKNMLKTVQVSPDGKGVAKDKTWITAEAKKALEDALEKAEQIAGNPNAEDAAIKEAIENLNQALKDNPPKAGLKDIHENKQPEKSSESSRSDRPFRSYWITSPEKIEKKASPVDTNKSQEKKSELSLFDKMTDVANSWAREAIKYNLDKGYFKGTSEGTFSPNRAITRGEFISILGRRLGLDPKVYPKAAMQDVEAGSFYEAYVNWAVAEGIAAGTADGNFQANRKISREEMATILSRYLEKTKKNYPKGEIVTYKDQGKISSWAKKSVDYLTQVGLVKGRGNQEFAPKEDFTRAEAAQILYLLDKK